MSDPAGPEQQYREALRSPPVLLAKQAAAHFGLWLLVFSMFAATDSWLQLTGWPLATVLAVVTGALAGFLTTNLAHEWFHYVGARLSGGRYSVNPRLGLFVFDWDFAGSSVRQFMQMSVAGTVGGLLAVLLLWQAVEPDSVSRAAVIAGALASFTFGSVIEWPVLRRVRMGGDPRGELERITPPVLGRAGAASLAAFVLGLLVL